MRLLNSSRVKGSEREIHKASENAKEDPRELARCYGNHLDLLLSLIDQIEHPELLQLGFWVDTLTVTLVRLKKWEDAKTRLEHFFALPDRVQGQPSPSSLDAMQKRLARCRRSLGIDPDPD